MRPVTYYQVRVFATNAFGRSEPSEAAHFRTDEEAPGGPPLHIKAQATSSKLLKISWEPPRKDQHFGDIRGYYIGYKVAGPETEAYVYKTLEIQERGFSEETQLTGLKRFTKYSVIVQAFNSKGAGPASEEIIAQTLQNGKCPYLQSREVFVITCLGD